MTLIDFDCKTECKAGFSWSASISSKFRLRTPRLMIQRHLDIFQGDSPWPKSRVEIAELTSLDLFRGSPQVNLEKLLLQINQILKWENIQLGGTC